MVHEKGCVKYITVPFHFPKLSARCENRRTVFILWPLFRQGALRQYISKSMPDGECTSSLVSKDASRADRLHRSYKHLDLLLALRACMALSASRELASGRRAKMGYITRSGERLCVSSSRQTSPMPHGVLLQGRDAAMVPGCPTTALGQPPNRVHGRLCGPAVSSFAWLLLRCDAGIPGGRP